jgi:hypothetical protein
MTRIVQVSALIFLSSFIFVQIAEARLIRGSGRTVISYQHETNYYFVENAELVDFANYTGMSEVAYSNKDSGFGTTTRTIGGGGQGISAVPTSGPSAAEDCNASYDFGDVAPVAEPCIWSIEEGEDLTAFGSFSMFFDNPLIEHQIEWLISGNGIVKTLDGSINAGLPINTPDGIIGTGQVMLEALWSDLDLLPGDYEISVNAIVSSSAGKFFHETRRLGTGTTATEVILERVDEENPAHNEWLALREAWERDILDPWFNNPVGPEPTFDIPEPPMSLVAYAMNEESQGFVDASDTLLLDSRFTLLQNFGPEILRIEAATSLPPVNSVSAPSAFILILTGGLLVLRRKTNLT